MGQGIGERQSYHRYSFFAAEPREKKIKLALKGFEGIEDPELKYAYDLTVFFEAFNFFNPSKMAEFTGINPGLIRQYSAGIKHPSKEQVEKIERALKELGKRLVNI